MAISSSSDVQADKLASLIADYENLDPDFIAELDTLSITIGDYELMLADSGPWVVTTNNSVS